MSYQSFLKLAGEPLWISSPLSMTLSSLPPVGNVMNCEISEVPTVEELGYEEAQQVCRNAFLHCPCCLNSSSCEKHFMQDEFSPFRGGESEALKRLRQSIENKVQCRILLCH